MKNIKNDSSIYSRRKSFFVKKSNKKNFLPPPPPPMVYPPKSIDKSSSGLMNTLKEGFSFGVGSSVAHNVINYMVTLPSSTPSHSNKTDSTNNIKLSFNDDLFEKYINCKNKIGELDNDCKKIIFDFENK